MLFFSLVLQSSEATVEHPVSEIVWLIQQDQVFTSDSQFKKRWLVRSAGLNAGVS